MRRRRVDLFSSKKEIGEDEIDSSEGTAGNHSRIYSCLFTDLHRIFRSAKVHMFNSIPLEEEKTHHARLCVYEPLTEITIFFRSETENQVCAA